MIKISLAEITEKCWTKSFDLRSEATVKVLLTDYLCVSSNSGQPIGHGKKVLTEMHNLLDGILEVSVYATSQYFERGPTKTFEEWLVEGIHTSPKTFSQKLACYYIKLKHIIKALGARGIDVVWFTNIDATLLQVLAFVPHMHKKLVVTIYRDLLLDSLENGKKKRALIRKGLEKCDLVVATNRNLKFPGIRMIYLPDYVYSPFYEKYRSQTKSIELLCIGTIGDTKDITGLVRAVNDTELSLVIAGLFKEEKIYKQCMKIKAENITVQNRLMSSDEYYSLIGKAKFVILPYNMVRYACATSGVLQEAIFLGATVIAPKQLLEYNSINGIGYDTIDQIPQLVRECYKYNISYQNDLSFFSDDNCKKIINDALLDICSINSEDVRNN